MNRQVNPNEKPRGWGGAFDCVFTLLKGYCYDFREVMEEFYHNRAGSALKMLIFEP